MSGPGKAKPRYWPQLLVALLAVAVCLGACDLSAALPIPAATPTACTVDCPPPVRAGGQSHTVKTLHFSLLYFDPWSIQSATGDGVTLTASTSFGTITVRVNSVEVLAGTTGPGLLAQAEQTTLDPSLYSNVEDNGIIRGAEIGYVDGAGESFMAESLQPNAPALTVYLQIMASVRGTVGLTFVAISPLNPNSPDGDIVPNAEYDHIVNSIQWL